MELNFLGVAWVCIPIIRTEKSQGARMKKTTGFKGVQVLFSGSPVTVRQGKGNPDKSVAGVWNQPVDKGYEFGCGLGAGSCKYCL